MPSWCLALSGQMCVGIILKQSMPSFMPSGLKLHLYRPKCMRGTRAHRRCQGKLDGLHLMETT
jgi:hypothetical protein